MTHPTVTTARAAEIVGVGYEVLRSYLKRVSAVTSGCFPASTSRAPTPKTTRFHA
ncbi:hypothetical protein [Croceicoccus mobilis]|uniref:Uncharacterized protein n=1 Tax=Croceicoccus mobilis TaxID=1703339 RepID=A0A917DZE4_9SPHN|nr:hypothetical protein [Croceicoccus mobilis]GGD83209.1 hypothetical protein GCM10010990_36610 [Croceicoccus mobilis]